MADLTQTKANVEAYADAKIEHGISADIINRGDPIYVNYQGNISVTDANNLGGTIVPFGSFDYITPRPPTTAPAPVASSFVNWPQIDGIALTDSILGQPVSYVTQGRMDVGATLTAGTVYVVSGNRGRITSIADLVSGDYTLVIGVAEEADVLYVYPIEGPSKE